MVGILDRLPYTDDYSVRNRIDELFSRKMLGAVLVGKFVGDFAAVLSTDVLGQYLGLLTGAVATITLFVYWDKVSAKAQETATEMNPSQSRISDFTPDEQQ